MLSIRVPRCSTLRQLTSSSAQSQSCWIRVSHVQYQFRTRLRYQQDHASSHHPMRSFHTTRSVKAFLDNSSIDFAYMPQFELEEPTQPEIMRIPLLPNNYTTPRNGDLGQQAIEPVIRPEISTVSADSTHIDSPSAMSEVTDNHSVELDPYDLTSKVTTAASKMAGRPVSTLKESGTVTQLWNGVLDDLLGSKKLSHT